MEGKTVVETLNVECHHDHIPTMLRLVFDTELYYVDFMHLASHSDLLQGDTFLDVLERELRSVGLPPQLLQRISSSVDRSLNELLDAQQKDGDWNFEFPMPFGWFVRQALIILKLLGRLPKRKDDGKMLIPKSLRLRSSTSDLRPCWSRSDGWNQSDFVWFCKCKLMKQIKSEDDDESEDQVHKDDEDEDDPRWPWWMAVGWLDEWLDDTMAYNGCVRIRNPKPELLGTMVFKWKMSSGSFHFFPVFH